MARPNKGRSVGGEANLAQRIAREREQRGLSYDALAKLMTEAGCSIQGSAIFKIEKADPPRRITVDELVALARVLGLTVDNLLTPIEVLDKQRAHELLTEMTDAVDAWLQAVNRVVTGYAEFYELAGHDPELYEYISWQPVSTADPDPAEASPPVVDPEVPGYDPWPFDSDSGEYVLRMIDEGRNIANARLEQSGNRTRLTLHPSAGRLGTREVNSDGH